MNKILTILVFIALSGCSIIAKQAEITSITVENGGSCEDINIRKIVLSDIISLGPPLVPIIPVFILDIPDIELAVVDCTNIVSYPIKKNSIGYFWVDLKSTCKYKIEIDIDYEYFPLWWPGGVAKPMSCYSFSELNESMN